MRIQDAGAFQVGVLSEAKLSEERCAKLMEMANEENSSELLHLLQQAQQIAEPVVLFGLCTTSYTTDNVVCINGVEIHSRLVAKKLKEQRFCFPFVATVGTALENWSQRFRGDFLEEYWAEEIKKAYLQQLTSEFFRYIKERYPIIDHLATLNPGSLVQWPISGQKELFAILGGTEFVQKQIGVRYTDCFLMLPSKSLSGIGFTSKTPYENCQYCGRLDCRDRREVPQNGG